MTLRKWHHEWAKHNEADYYSLLKLQDYGCGICGVKDKELVVDHNHETMLVRGLLCIRCNNILNKYTEVWLYLAIDYLRRAENRPLVDDDYGTEAQ